jgi:hypothetical protein
MNKILAWLPALMVLAAIAYKPVKEATRPDLVNKNISVAVYKSSDYTSDAYDNTSAQLHIKVEKVNTRGQHTIVWDKVMDAKELSAYPSIENAVKQNIAVHNLNEKKEYLIVDYTLTYNSQGNELQMHDAIVVKDSNSSKVDISL